LTVEEGATGGCLQSIGGMKPGQAEKTFDVTEGIKQRPEVGLASWR
jgi:hypothetical protein